MSAVRFVSLLLALLLAVLVRTPDVRTSDHARDVGTVEAASSHALGQARPPEPEPQRPDLTPAHVAPRSRCVRRARDPRVRRLLSRGTRLPFPYRACMHVPRRRLPRLGDDDDDP